MAVTPGGSQEIFQDAQNPILTAARKARQLIKEAAGAPDRPARADAWGAAPEEIFDHPDAEDFGELEEDVGARGFVRQLPEGNDALGDADAASELGLAVAGAFPKFGQAGTHGMAGACESSTHGAIIRRLGKLDSLVGFCLHVNHYTFYHRAHQEEGELSRNRLTASSERSRWDASRTTN